MTDFRLHRPGIVGTGRVAQALTLAFAPHASAPPLVWGRTPDNANSTATATGASRARTIDRLTTECDIIAIAVSDDAMSAVVADIAATVATGRAPFVFHVSGRSGAAILEPLRAAGATTAAIHPAMTFTGEPQAEAQRMVGASFAVTGSTPEATRRAGQIVTLLGGITVEIDEEHRSLYHAALCHASNHLVTLIAGAANSLRDAGVDNPSALLTPLVRAALENSLDRGFAGLSGPLLRGDAETVKGHLVTLKDHSPDLLPAYRAMARATLDELKRAGTLPSDRLTALDSLLAVP